MTGNTIIIQIFGISLLKSVQFLFISGNVTSLFILEQKNMFPLLSYLRERSSQNNMLV